MKCKGFNTRQSSVNRFFNQFITPRTWEKPLLTYRNTPTKSAAIKRCTLISFPMRSEPENPASLPSLSKRDLASIWIPHSRVPSQAGRWQFEFLSMRVCQNQITTERTVKGLDFPLGDLNRDGSSEKTTSKTIALRRLQENSKRAETINGIFGSFNLRKLLLLHVNAS